jgi:phosphatidylglycerophosphate synthase
MTASPLAELSALVIGAIAIIGHGFATRRTPPSPTIGLHEWFGRWQVQHRAPDLDPSTRTVLRLFLTMTYRLGRPLARAGVSPTTVTFAGVWVAATVPIVAGWQPAVAALVCVASSLLDGVDGAVAGLQDRATRFGFVLDSVADRVAEAAFFGALVAAGGHLAVAAAGWAGVILLEYVRARAGVAGLDEVGVVTIAERPTRVLCVSFGLLGAAVVPGHATAILDGSGVIAAVTAMVGMAQLLVVIRERFAGQEPT